MSFGSKRLDAAYDRWATQTPEEYFGEEEEYDEDELIDEKEIKKEITKSKNVRGKKKRS